MSEPKTIQEVVMQSIQAEDSGVIVDWKQTCLQIVNAAQAEFARITAEQEEETQMTMDDLETGDS